MNTSVENIHLEYGDLDSDIAPKLFRNNNYTLRFNSATHTMEMDNNAPAYHIYQFHKSGKVSLFYAFR